MQGTRKKVYQAVIAIQIILISLILLSDFFKSYLLKFMSNDTYEAFNENKLAAAAVVFLFGMMALRVIKSSGAFEIFYNGKLVWSTIDNYGKVPNGEFFIRLIQTDGKGF